MIPEKRKHADRLQQRKWNSEKARILVNFFPAIFTLLGEFFKFGKYDGKQLQNNRCVDIGVEPEGHD